MRHGYETVEIMHNRTGNGAEEPMDTRTIGVMGYRENYKEIQKNLGLD